MKFAANLAFLFPDRPLVERIRAAAEAGFGAVEMQWPYDVPAEQIRSALSQNNMTMLGINAPKGGRAGDVGLAGIPGRESEFRETFAQALDYALAIGALSIHCLSGAVEPSVGMATYVKNIVEAAALAAKHNIRILLEPLNLRDNPGYMMRSTGLGVSAIKDIGMSNVQLMFDCYHVQVIEGDVVRRFEQALPFIGHVQIASAPARQEPDDGELNYLYVLDAMKKLGFIGWVGAEYRPRGKTEDGLGWLATWQDKFND